jgi:hypothetical protein
MRVCEIGKIDKKITFLLFVREAYENRHVFFTKSDSRSAYTSRRRMAIRDSLSSLLMEYFTSPPLPSVSMFLRPVLHASHKKAQYIGIHCCVTFSDSWITASSSHLGSWGGGGG